MQAVIRLIKDRGVLREPPPLESEGRGIVISGGGKYLDWAWVNCRWTRHLGVTLPIQVWHLGPKEIPNWARQHFEALDVQLVDAHEVRRTHWHRRLIGWHLKQYAAMRCPWREVLSLDADCFLARDPAFVLDSPEFQAAGAFFCGDVNKCRKNDWGYLYAAVRTPEREMESGYFAWDRVKAWQALQMIHFIAEHGEVWDRCFWGDKDYPYLGFETMGVPYVFDAEPRWEGSGISHFWKGERLCNHIMAHKRGEHPAHDPLIPALFEEWRSLQR